MNDEALLTFPIAIIASQMRLLDMIEKIYGDSAFSNPVFAEYKRALENIERESKDNLVTCQNQSISFFFLTRTIGSCLPKDSHGTISKICRLFPRGQRGHQTP